MASVPQTIVPLFQHQVGFPNIQSPVTGNVTSATTTRPSPISHSASYGLEVSESVTHSAQDAELSTTDQRPRAMKVRAVESTALGTEQIDSLFQMQDTQISNADSHINADQATSKISIPSSPYSTQANLPTHTTRPLPSSSGPSSPSPHAAIQTIPPPCCASPSPFPNLSGRPLPRLSLLRQSPRLTSAVHVAVPRYAYVVRRVGHAM